MKSEHSVPTMKDVAREAGVALGTVSKVVNGIPVGESYRLRVEDAISHLTVTGIEKSHLFKLESNFHRIGSKR